MHTLDIYLSTVRIRMDLKLPLSIPSSKVDYVRIRIRRNMEHGNGFPTKAGRLKRRPIERSRHSLACFVLKRNRNLELNDYSREENMRGVLVGKDVGRTLESRF